MSGHGFAPWRMTGDVENRAFAEQIPRQKCRELARRYFIWAESVSTDLDVPHLRPPLSAILWDFQMFAYHLKLVISIE